MFFCRLTQEHQDKIVIQLAVQMNEALKREDDRLARDIAKKEAEQEKKRKEKEAKEKAAIESIAEHRATVVRNPACSYSCLFQGAWPRSQLVAPVPWISMLHQVCWWRWRSADILPGVFSPSPTYMWVHICQGCWKPWAWALAGHNDRAYQNTDRGLLLLKDMASSLAG